MRHSKRTTLTADDVDGALNLRNVEVSTMLEQMASVRVLNLHAFDGSFSIIFICKYSFISYILI